MTGLSATVLLFLVMDPVGNVSLFLSILKGVRGSRYAWIVLREHVIALGVLVFFLFAGRYVLEAFGLDETSIGIAGGIVLFIIAIKMVFPTTEGIFGKSPVGKPFIVPLAVPLIAGPSALATVLLLGTGEPGRGLEWLTAIIFAWLGSLAILMVAPELIKRLGDRTLVAVERLMGLVLTAVAVKMLLAGIKRFIAS